MTDTPFPLPRATRQTDVLDGDGATTVFGPFSFKIFDIEDVEVQTRLDGEDFFSVAAATVAKTSADAFADFTVTFAAAPAETTEFIVIGRREPMRQVAVTKGGSIAGAELEKELSKQAVALSEFRRDLDRAYLADVSGEGRKIATLPEGHFPMADADGNLIDGGSSQSITDAADAAAASAGAAAASAGAAAGSATSAFNSASAAAVFAASASDSADAAAAAAASLLPYTTITPTAAGLALLDDADPAAQRVTLGLEIGVNVQAHSDNLAALAGVVPGALGLALLAAVAAADGRTALELGSAALLTAGSASGNLKALNADGGFTFATTATSLDVAGNFGGAWKVAHRSYSSDAATFSGSRATAAIMREVTGSGENGPDRADYALHLEAWKTNYLTSGVQGEVDVLNLVGRQSELGDTSMLLFNSHKVESTVYGQTGLEGLLRWVQATTGTVLRETKITTGANIPGTDIRAGGTSFSTQIRVGTLAAAFLATNNGGTGINRVLVASSTLAVADRYVEITGDAHADGAGLVRAGAGAVGTPSLAFIGDPDTGLYSASGNVIGFATAGTVRMLVGPGVRIGAGLTDPGAGILNVLTSISINGTKVIGARDTGWTAMTGTAAKGTFDTETMTALQCARKLKALTDALTTHGLIGA